MIKSAVLVEQRIITERQSDRDLSTATVKLMHSITGVKPQRMKLCDSHCITTTLKPEGRSHVIQSSDTYNFMFSQVKFTVSIAE